MDQRNRQRLPPCPQSVLQGMPSAGVEKESRFVRCPTAVWRLTPHPASHISALGADATEHHHLLQSESASSEFVTGGGPRGAAQARLRAPHSQIHHSPNRVLRKGATKMRLWFSINAGGACDRLYDSDRAALWPHPKTWGAQECVP